MNLELNLSRCYWIGLLLLVERVLLIGAASRVRVGGELLLWVG